MTVLLLPRRFSRRDVLTFAVETPKMQDIYGLPSYRPKMASTNFFGPGWTAARNRYAGECDQEIVAWRIRIFFLGRVEWEKPRLRAFWQKH